MTPSAAPPPRTSQRSPASDPPGVGVAGFFAAWAKMTRSQTIFIVAWCALIVISTFVLFQVLTAAQRRNVELANERHRARLSPGNVVGQTEPERTPPPGHENDVPRTVNVGAYVDRVSELSIVDSSWKLDFYVWFNWQGDDLNPGETFRVVNGEVLSRTLMKKSDAGDRHYALYQASAQITKKFDVSRFPRDEHQLTLSVEDGAAQSYQVTYITDPAASSVSSRVDVQGYAVAGIETSVKPHSYRSSMGDPALPQTYKATYSQFTVAIPIKRASWGLYLKMFLTLYIAVGIALGGLVLVSPSERLAMGGTAMFVAIMNGEANAAFVPSTGQTTLGDVINVLGYLAIGTIIVQAIIYHRFFSSDERPPVVRVFDAMSIVLLSASYVILNAGVLLAAS
jgi:hypothetical protein